MMFFEKIKKEIEKKNYKVYEVNLALEVVKNGIQFENFEKLQDFMYDQKIDVMFFCKYYDNPYNYIITEETFRNSRTYYDYNIIDIISNDIDKYNKEILKIDFDEPCAVIVACIFEGQYCFVYLENDKLFNREELIESEKNYMKLLKKINLVLMSKKQKTKKLLKN